ncbi:MAG: glutamate synthase subunit beta [Candidatus Omnitrophica bacterium]|nr:glutamate synthase subunit beta [Candidatus Omnitrophota bacterium]
MGDPQGFQKVGRQTSEGRPVRERLRDYREVPVMRKDEQSKEQASRCMDCGTPFCHWGCPLGNYIPEWNDFMFDGHWEKAFELLQATNDFPEFTGRVCPATCEYACVLGINDDPVTIRENELAVIEYAFRNGMIKPRPPVTRTGKNVAVIGSGPAGLACAAQLNRAGHNVVVYEKDDKIGGILRYGIPDFKLEKGVIDRRLSLMREEGIKFEASVNVGMDYDARTLLKEYDAVCLAGGSRVPRDLTVEGRGLEGIYFAMDYLTQSNRRISGGRIPADRLIDAGGRKVVVIGGGDTGSDCVGTAGRQGALSVTQIELLPKPPESRAEDQHWPVYPVLLKTSTSHEEGGDRIWSVRTKRFAGEKGRVNKLGCVRVEFVRTDEKAPPVMKDIPGSGFEIEADLVVLALGFIRPEHGGLLTELGVELDERGNVRTGEGLMTSVSKVFSAGDMRRGQSLVVWAISEGRRAAHSIDVFLTGQSNLPYM